MTTRRNLRERQGDKSDIEYIINSSQVFDGEQKIILKKIVEKIIERNFEHQERIATLENHINVLNSRINALENNT
jgi:vacuolar-type H+-ATPase subunit D/Vma8